jgi:hypothetical protein
MSGVVEEAPVERHEVEATELSSGPCRRRGTS